MEEFNKTGDSVLEAEIKALEAQLQEKKQKLKSAAHEESVKEEKEIFAEVLREHIANFEKEPEPAVAAGDQGTAPDASSDPAALAAKRKADEIREAAHEQQIDELVAIAFTKGIVEAVHVARHLNNPHILDDFHDAVIDDYYDKLMSARTSEPTAASQ